MCVCRYMSDRYYDYYEHINVSTRTLWRIYMRIKIYKKNLLYFRTEQLLDELLFALLTSVYKYLYICVSTWQNVNFIENLVFADVCGWKTTKVWKGKFVFALRSTMTYIHLKLNSQSFLQAFFGITCACFYRKKFHSLTWILYLYMNRCKGINWKGLLFLCTDRSRS